MAKKLQGGLRNTLSNVLVNHKTRAYHIANDVLGALTILSIVSIILETVPSLHQYNVYFKIIEWTALAFFTAEYAARIYIARPARSYIFSFFGLVDLIAILPSYLGLGNLSFLKSARTLRILRLLRMVRLAKISRIDGKDAEETVGIFGFNILIYALTLTFAMLIIGSLLYTIEDPSAHILSIPAGMFWTFKLFLGGLPLEVPSSQSGLTVYILAKFTGMALFGLLVGIVGKIFNKVALGSGK